MQKFNITSWVEADPEHLTFRQAVHTVLTAISGTPYLQTSMIMKGGVLLALGYNSQRYTQDIDFSTSLKLAGFNCAEFRKRMDEGLVYAIEDLGYGLDCRIQGIEQKPSREDATFPTIITKVGYAYKGEANAHKRLMAGQSTRIIKLDYSLNEPVGTVDFFELEEGNVIRTYGIVELIAEKFRALLQQQERKRVRGQDLYDLYHIFTTCPLVDNQIIKAQVLQRLIEKSSDRNLSISSESMSDPSIMKRTQEGYDKLYSDIEGELLPFDVIYESIERSFRALPWE